MGHGCVAGFRADTSMETTMFSLPQDDTIATSLTTRTRASGVDPWVFSANSALNVWT